MAIVGRQWTPWAAWYVVLMTETGKVMEVPFATEVEAKAFLYKIPHYQLDIGGPWLKVKAATIRNSFISLN